MKKEGNKMRDKLINKRTILLLTAIFMLSMSSYAPAEKGDKKPSRPSYLYKVTISINDSSNEDQVPGIENLDMVDGVPYIVCGSEGYFYAEKVKTGKNLILKIESKGSDTPVPLGEMPAPLNMWVKTGINGPIELEGCFFSDGCHGELPLPNFHPGKIWITFFKAYDGPGGETDLGMRWWLDSYKESRKYWQGWIIYSFPYEEAPLIQSSNPYPPNFDENPIWETDVTGPFVLAHDGIACDGTEDMWAREVLEGFDIHLKIEKVR